MCNVNGDAISYEIRPCISRGDDVESGPHISDDDAAFWGVYRNETDGTQSWVEDFSTKQAAVEFVETGAQHK